MSLALSAFTASAFADGPLDPSFGDSGFGFQVLKIGDSSTITESSQISALSQDADGQLVTAGVSQRQLFVARHRSSPDGNLDGAFGDKGVATSFFGDNNNGATSVRVDHHGHIVAGGFVSGDVACPDGDEYRTFFTAVRLNDDRGKGGDADFTFGSFGIALYGGCDQDLSGVADIAIDDDDAVIAVGSANPSSSDLTEHSTVIALIRWTASGILDTSFGESGAQLTSYGDSAGGVSVKRDKAGRILVAAIASESENRIPLVLRYTPDGKLDSTFGKDGIAALPPIAIRASTYGNVCCLAVDLLGRIYIAGGIDDNGDGYFGFLARVTSSGSLDATFGVNGVAIVPYGRSYVGSLVLDHSSRPILAGYCSVYVYAESCVTHFNLDGTINRTLGDSGIYTTQLGFGQTYATSLLVDGLGRPTIAAIAYDTSGIPQPVLIRYDEMFGDGFD
jgi:uncharacterized delta-60 repeat protein